MKYVGYTILALIGMFALYWIIWGIGVGMGIITLGSHQVSNRVQTAHDVIDASVNAQNCLQWQDWFRTQEGTIKTLQITVQNAQDALDAFNTRFPDSSKWTDAQNQQYTVLTDNVTGVKNEANDAINSYDAKSQQENFAICKSGLPVHIQPF